MKRFLLAAAKAIGMFVLIAAASMAGGALVMLTRPADASRDGSGTYTFAANSMNPAVFGTPISPTDFNTFRTDLTAGLTDSLSRAGNGGMLAALRLNNAASVSAPDLAWTAETNTGWRRAASGDIRFGVAGADKQFLSANGLGIGAASPHSSVPFFVLGAGPSVAFVSRSAVNARVYSNSYFNGTNDVYNANGVATMLSLGGVTNDITFFSAPSGTAGGTVTFTERAKVNETGFSIGASGTAIGASKVATQSVTWGANCVGPGLLTTTQAVTNVAFGDSCSVAAPANMTAGQIPICYVSAAGTVTFGVACLNGTAAPPNGTWTIRTLQATN